VPERGELATVSEQALTILKIGLGDHLRCAIAHRFSEQNLKDEQMSELLGEGYSGMTSIVQTSIPVGYQLTAGHRCQVDGRSFAHLILKKPEGFVSLIVTRKQGESYAVGSSEKTFSSFGANLHEAQLEGFEVAGFETKEHLGFFVSGLGRQENFTVASRMAPALQEYLLKLEI